MNDLINITDYRTGKTADIIIPDAHYKKKKVFIGKGKTKKIGGAIKINYLFDKHLFSVATTRNKTCASSFHIKCRRDFKFLNKYAHYHFHNKLYCILIDIDKNKPNFIKKHFSIIRLYYTSDEQIYFRITEQLWSYIQQKYNFDNIYISQLFSETEFNKRMKEKEVEDLLDKTLYSLKIRHKREI